MKKVFFFLFIFLIFKVDFSRGLEATNLYYYDDNKNQKIDRIRLEFDNTITGTLDFSKLQLYSNTGWIATFKINSEIGYFSWYTMSWNLLDLSLIEQDNSKIDLTINDTTTSDLRLKSLLWIGVTDLSGVEMTKLSLTTSFNNYNSSNIFNRTLEVLENNPVIMPDIPPAEVPLEIPPEIPSTNDWTWEIVSTWSTEDPSSIPKEQKLYYFDKNSNWKIDTLELEYDKTLTWSLDLSKIKIYSNSWWLATFKIDTLTGIVNNFYLSGNILWLNLVEQDNFKLNLSINNTTASDLRLKSLSWIWIKDLFWNEIDSLSLTTSFNSYNSLNIFNETSEILINSWEIIPENPTPNLPENNDNSWGTIENVPIIEIPEPIITIQSWLNSSLVCNSIDCIVNYTWVDSFSSLPESNYSCLWDFWWWIHTAWNEMKCNPGYVHYQAWNYTIKFRIIDKTNSANYKEKIINISNIYSPSWGRTSSQITQENTIIFPKAVLTLQWTINGKTKKQSGNKVYCYMDNCSINFTGEHSIWEKLEYFWNFGNWITSDKENPIGIIYKIWNYNVTLKIKDKNWNISEDYFDVFVSLPDKNLEIPEETIENISLDLNISNIKISKVNPNPYWNDDFEWIELENTWDTKISLTWCTLDDDISKWSKAFKFKNTFIESKSLKKFYKLDTGLSLNNDKDSVNFICNWNILDNTSWNYNVPDGYIITKNEDINKSIKVVRVIDWDTIVVFLNWKEEKIRLIGVDTPETVHPNKEIEFYWKEASNYVKSILENREVSLEFDFDRFDKYWRILAYVWIDGIMLNKTLIEKWYARVYLRFPFKYAKEFEKIWNQTQKNKVWIWSQKEIYKYFDSEIKLDKIILDKILKKEKENDLDKELAEILAIEDKELFKKKMEKFLQKILKISTKKKETWEIIISWNILPNLDIYFEILEKNISSSGVSFTPPNLPLKRGGINRLLAFNWDISDLNNFKYSTKSDENWDFNIELDNVNFEDFTLKTYAKYIDETYFLWKKDFNKEKISFAKEVENGSNKIIISLEEINLDDYKIIIQWKKSKDKEIWEDYIICKTKKYCSVNFSLSGSKNDELNYIWNFWNNEEFIWFNPKSLHYFPGNYILTLKILDKDYNILRELNLSIKVTKILPKKRGRKTTKKTKIKKEFILNFLSNKEEQDEKLWDKNIAFSWISLSFLILFLVYFIARKHENNTHKHS